MQELKNKLLLYLTNEKKKIQKKFNKKLIKNLIKEDNEFNKLCIDLIKNYPQIQDYTANQLLYILKNNISFDSLLCECNLIGIKCNNFKHIENNILYSLCKIHKSDKDIVKKLKLFKSKKTCIEKYGVSRPFQNKDFLEKAKETFKKNYNVDNPSKSITVKEKISNSLKKTFQNDKNTILEKRRYTCLKNYNVDNPMKSKEIQEKAQKTMLQKYGVKFYGQTQEYKSKIKNLHPSQKHLKNLDKLNKEFIEENFLDENRKFKLKEFIDFYGYCQPQAHEILKKFDIQYNKTSYSQSEKEIVNFIKEIYSGEIIENSRKIISPYEIDIYIPEKNLAIEFNGLFWHSIDSKDLINEFKFKHLKKIKAAEEKNINLLHIFENEWLDPRKQEIWKSIISYKLGLINEKYYARKLRVIEIDSKVSSQFFEENHLQGNASASIKLALINSDNEIISAMTFAKPRFSTNAEYELIRFASRKFTACVGCAQKLFKHFIEKYQPKSVISYANRRWAYSKSNIYQKLGFEFIRETEPNYFYFKLNKMILYPRVKFQKHKLKNLKTYDPSLTESEIMFNSGYRRIYDAGNLVYLWRA